MVFLETLAAVAACTTIAFAIAAAQAFIGAKIGTDHPGHVFLVRAIRINRFRLFVRIPRLLNFAVVAALPLYLHWLFAHVRDRWTYWAERLLNPAMSAAHIGLFAAILASAEGGDHSTFIRFAGTVACFAFTPQFFHALSARNFGLSSRGAGLLLLTGTLFSAFNMQTHSGIEWYIGGALLAYMIWGFSTFAAQALIIISIMHALIFGRFEILASSIFGLAIFLIVHPRYSIGYLRYTINFIYKYATDLAPIYILSRRPSLWRDLVSDIWREIAQDRRKGLRYAYENGILIALFLNPLLVIAIAWRMTAGSPHIGIISFAGEMAICGATAMLLTSFRQTRFLGEPERYIEAVTPWSTLAGAAALVHVFGDHSVAAVASLFLALDLVQLGMSHMLFRYLTGKNLDIRGAESAIAAFSGNNVRLASNNEHLTKQFMYNDWHFAFYIAAGVDYCGLSITQAFSRFPILRPEAFEHIVEQCRINVCVMDREVGEDLFRAYPHGLKSIVALHETPALRVFGLTWDEQAPGISTGATV
jgi:hypothetical protein